MSEVTKKDALSTAGYWDGVWDGQVRLRLPSSYIVATRNLQQLLRKYVRPGDSFLEIGCAPGKMLAWVAVALEAQVSGLDYSEAGLTTARQLFAALGIPGDLRCEEIGTTTFAPASFDVVYSSGLIEHFADPREIVRQHLSLVKPGGTAVITVPDYHGIYGTLQRYFDADILSIHNLDIMTCDALVRLVPDDHDLEARAFPSGRMSPWVLTIATRWPRVIALVVSHLANAAALLQPVEVSSLCPMLVLEVRRGRH